jgi:putative cell wall-binding protein
MKANPLTHCLTVLIISALVLMGLPLASPSNAQEQTTVRGVGITETFNEVTTEHYVLEAPGPDTAQNIPPGSVNYASRNTDLDLRVASISGRAEQDAAGNGSVRYEFNSVRGLFEDGAPGFTILTTSSDTTGPGPGLESCVQRATSAARITGPAVTATDDPGRVTAGDYTIEDLSAQLGTADPANPLEFGQTPPVGEGFDPPADNPWNTLPYLRIYETANPANEVVFASYTVPLAEGCTELQSECPEDEEPVQLTQLDPCDEEPAAEPEPEPVDPEPQPEPVDPSPEPQPAPPAPGPAPQPDPEPQPEPEPAPGPQPQPQPEQLQERARCTVLARSDIHPDSLSVSTLASGVGAPILLTPPELPLSSYTLDALRADAPDVLIVAGGPEAISVDALAAALDAVNEGRDEPAGFLRVGGFDRHHTAALLLEQVRTAQETGSVTSFIYQGPEFLNTLSRTPDAEKMEIPSDYSCEWQGANL